MKPLGVAARLRRAKGGEGNQEQGPPARRRFDSRAALGGGPYVLPEQLVDVTDGAELLLGLRRLAAQLEQRQCGDHDDEPLDRL